MAKTKKQAARQAADRPGAVTDRQAKIAAAKKASGGDGPNRALIATLVAVVLIAAVVGVAIFRVVQDRNAINQGGKAVPAGAAGMGQAWYPPEYTPAASAPTVWVFEDFRCPICKTFEDTFGPTVEQEAKDGKIKLGYVFKTVIDGNLGSNNSQTAASNALCAADGGKYSGFHDWLYANQPAEGTLFTKEQFAQAAASAGLAGDALSTFTKCNDAGKYMNYVKSTEDQSFKDGVTGTPALYVNGTPVTWQSLRTADGQPDTAALVKILQSGEVPADLVNDQTPKIPVK